MTAREAVRYIRENDCDFLTVENVQAYTGYRCTADEAQEAIDEARKAIDAERERWLDEADGDREPTEHELNRYTHGHYDY